MNFFQRNTFLLLLLLLTTFTYGQKTYFDKFDAVSYAGNNGSENFSSNWFEVRDDGSPANGTITVSGGRLRFQNMVNGYVARRLSMPNTNAATLSFDFNTTNIGNKVLRLYLNDAAGNFVNVYTIPSGINSSVTFNLPATYRSVNSGIAFFSPTANWAPGETATIDNVKFTTSVDTDGDGVLDQNDDDDDNDGILDAHETLCGPDVSGYDGYWNVENTTNGTKENPTDAQRNAAAGSNVSYSADSRKGFRSAFFNGTSNYISYSNNPYLTQQLTNFSYSFWAKPANFTGIQTLMEEGGSDNGVAIRLNGTTLQCAVREGGQVNLDSFQFPNDGRWHHIGFTYANGVVVLYLDGVSTTPLNTGFGALAAHTDAQNFGRTANNDAFGSTTPNYYQGLLDEMVHYPNALSKTQMTSMFEGRCDIDGDNIINSKDTDSDNDGCSDADEAYNNINADADNNGRFGTGNPAVNAQGRVNAASYNTPADTNNDGTPDYLQAGGTINIDAQPEDQITEVGGSVTFSVSASGNIQSYQWFRSNDGGTNYILISGANANTFTINPVSLADSGDQFRVEIRANNNICNNTTSTAALLTIGTDSDGDGVFDGNDLDDDNDGITDCAENGAENATIGEVFSLSGDALEINDLEVQLTPEANSKAGSATITDRIDFSNSFSFSFEAYLGTKDSGADGVAIIFHNDPDEALAVGDQGIGLGARSIVDGIVLELDTFSNGATVGDIPNDHGMIWDSDNQNGAGLLTTAIDLGNLEDGNWHPVSITWNAETQNILYWVDGILAGNFSGDLVNNYFGGANLVYFGFSASTGGLNNDQRIRFTNLCDIPIFADEDGDGIPNQLDTDSDNDGCSDADEAYNNVNADTDNNGRYGNGSPAVDSDGQVLAASYQVPEDTDNNGKPNYLEPKTTITAQPQDVSVAHNDSASFSVSATGLNLTYRWFVSTNSGTSYASNCR